MSQGSTPATTTRTDEQNNADTVVTTRQELEAAFDDLSTGDTIRISNENAPYRTTQWLDINVDGVTVVGPGVQTLIKPANGANVGGIRIGHNNRCSEIDIRGVGYHGNPNGQGNNAERLHGIAIRDAVNVTIEGSLIRQTYPVQHGNGGSGISVTRNCSGVRIFDTKIDKFGDRGIQLGGDRHMVYGNVITNGLDRPIACDVWPSSEANQTAESVSIFGNLLGNSFEGSLFGVARNTPVAENVGYVNIVGNVGFGSHKSFCHVRGPKKLRNISIQNNTSIQNTEKLQTDRTKFAGVAVSVSEGRNLAIKNNELYGYSGHGIHVNSDVSDVTIQHNGLFDAGLAGIRLVGGQSGLVNGNLVTGANQAGIRLKRATNVAIRGNYVRQVGTAGIMTGGSKPTSGHEIADNYVAATNQQSGKSFPAILVRDSGVRVRGNTVRQNGAPAIAEPRGVTGNIYQSNWADGDDPWQIASPASRIRDHVPPIDVHRGVSAESGSDTVRVEFDRAYARRPHLAFGQVGGAVQQISFVTDENSNYVGAEITVGRNGATFDISVNEL